MIMFTLMLPVLMGLIGLGIDCTVLYLVEAKISAAVDGAALGAGRLLGTSANTVTVAGDFLKANFCPSTCTVGTAGGTAGGATGYWGSYNLTPTINYTNSLGTYTIAINATVQVPLLFLRVVPMLVPQTSATVGANATAVRRSTRTIMVLDRSGSMNDGSPTAFSVMQQGAEAFAADFLPGTDEIGLVMLQSSAIVGYPTNYPLTYPLQGNVSGGPDTAFDTSATAGPVMTALQNMTAGGGTATPEALALAYVLLQQAHTRDLAKYGVDNMLNSIILFTDGVPDAIAVSPNSPVVWSIASNSWVTNDYSGLSSSSPCTNTYSHITNSTGWKSNGTWAANSSVLMMGTIVASGGPPNSWGSALGLEVLGAYYPSGSSTGSALTYWEQNPGDNDNNSSQNGTSGAPMPSTSVAGCKYLGNNKNTSITSDLQSIPQNDIYGVSTNPASGYPYKNATLVQSDGSSSNPYSSVSYPPSGGISDKYYVPIAAWNTTDNVGTIIRSQTAMNQITIYAIGFSGDGGVDSYLLTRLSNQGGVVSNTQSLGQYIQVDSLSQLTNAFQLVASYILHLSQ
jgi:Flp pilus assembly protein TadG